MSVMMSTVNPEAVNYESPADLPQMSDMVVYRTRPGEGRRGKNEFPAMVLGQNNSRGRFGLDLIVCYDANDVVTYESVQMLDEHNDCAVWRVRDGGAEDVRAQLRELKEENAALRAAVFGDWNVPEKGLMDYLVDFEKRIEVVEATAKKAQAPTAKKASTKA